MSANETAPEYKVDGPLIDREKLIERINQQVHETGNVEEAEDAFHLAQTAIILTQLLGFADQNGLLGRKV